MEDGSSGSFSPSKFSRRRLHPSPVSRHFAFAALTFAALLLAACAPPGPRPHYSREHGTWIVPESPNYSRTAPAGLGRARGSAADLRRVAEGYLGVPYRWGGETRKGMDCSGFVQRVFREAHQLRLPRTSAAMERFGKPVSKGSLKTGDLVFFKRVRVDHVGIYMGGGYFIHSQSGVGVVYTKLDAPYFARHFAGAKRITN